MPNNLLNKTALNRVKKYDRYQARPNTLRRSKNPVLISEVIPKKSYLNSGGSRNTISSRPYRTEKKVFEGWFTPVKTSRPATSLQLAMHSVATSTYQTPTMADVFFIPKSIKKHAGIVSKIFYVVGTIVFVCSVLISSQTFLFNRQAKEKVNVLSAQTDSAREDTSVPSVDPQGVVQGTQDKPSEDKPKYQSIADYRVSPEKPRYLRIPKLKTFSRVKTIGNTSAGAVGAPYNIYDTTWYTNSVLPGSKTGVSLILGHVAGWSENGVFKNLKKLTPGDEITVEKGNGEVIEYVVDKAESLPLEGLDMAKILYEVPTGKHSLRLMTCTGTYDSRLKEYTSRFVVYASPV